MFYEVIPEGKVEALTYNCDDSLKPGQIVLVPIGRRQVPGVVIKKVAQPEFATKGIVKVLYSKPLPRHLLATVGFIHDYYLVPTGQAVSLILPRGVQKKRRASSIYSLSESCRLLTSPKSDSTFRDSPLEPSPAHEKAEHLFGGFRAFSKTEQSTLEGKIRLNEAQKNALIALQKAPGATKLLYGVTGSGKTNIYLKMALNTLERHFSTILLVPEIALTSQLVRVFSEVLDERVVVIHSGLTEAERHLLFERILMTDEPIVVIGARSALFAPLAKLGLIIIDEEHENSYYQENAPKYSAVRVASFMAKSANASLVLGSATPTVEDYYIASKQSAAVQLTQKAKQSAIKPDISILDFKDRGDFSKNRYFSNKLLTAIKRNLASKHQTLIFHNRRGSSPLTICDSCGEEILCPSCFLPLTLHADTYTLQCHTCGFTEKVPVGCPKCGAPGLIHKGFGTKLLESEICKLFPEARVRRFDADNKKGEGLEAQYSSVRDGEVDILIGTQTVAKGLDLPRLATVGIVQADAGLSLPDYLAEERTFQLITQVIGRVGRGHLDIAEVYIQTYQPEHPVLGFAASEDYLGFYDYAIARRRKAGFPPFCFVMRLEITMKTERIVVGKVRDLVSRLMKDKRLVVSPPQPSFHERTSQGYTWQIVVRSRSRKALVESCVGLDKNFRITLDPPGLL